MNFEAMGNFMMVYGARVLFALVVLYVGFKITNSIAKKMAMVLEGKDVDKSVADFSSSISSWLLKIALVIAAASMVGIQTTSFIAILGAAGLAVGLALQGSLGNFAGGVLILLLKPFKVGDFINTQGFSGTVNKITVFSTFLKTPDNQVICLPNGALANSAVVNVNSEKTRRVDFSFSIGYQDDIDRARTVLSEVLASDIRVLKDPAVDILVGELGESSVNLFARAWVNTPDYWGVHFDIKEAVKKAFDEQRISFPYPQSDLHIYQTH